MKIISTFFLCFWVSFYTQFVCGAELNNEESKLAQLLNPENVERIVLIGFSDSHIKRIQKTASSYRRRGNYKSSSWSRRITDRIETKHGILKLSEWPMTEVGVHCAVYLIPSGKSVNETIEQLSHEDSIEIVQRMKHFKTQGNLYNDPYYQLQSNLHQMEIETAHKASTGKDVTIAVIDTGVDFDHPDLAGQIITNKNFVSSISAGFSEDIHGTAVSGLIVARKDNQTGIIGVAPDAKLIAFKACWPNHSVSFDAICNSYTLALAINTAIKLNVDILNMSLAGPEDPLLKILLNKARQKGIIVVAADPGSIQPDNRFPASLDWVISVQAINENHKQKAVIRVPGENILTTLPFGTYDFVSGSSMAAAQVTGIVALMLELHPDLTADQARYLLKKPLTNLNTSESVAHVSHVNVGAILNNLCSENKC